MNLYKDNICYKYNYKYYIGDNDEKLYTLDQLEINLKISKFKINKIIKLFELKAKKCVNGYTSISLYGDDDLKKIYSHIGNKNFKFNYCCNKNEKHKKNRIDKYMSTAFFHFASKRFEI